MSTVAQKLQQLEKERNLISKVSFSNDCLILLTNKDEIIAYDLITDKLSRHFGDSNIVLSLKSDFGGSGSVSYVDGKLFYFNGSAVFVESELIMKC
jgi:hypothetical protein